VRPIGHQGSNPCLSVMKLRIPVVAIQSSIQATGSEIVRAKIWIRGIIHTVRIGRYPWGMNPWSDVSDDWEDE
jgi:hypothetical protein